ncbi:hypothetical protein HPP92_026156 [Vanilla planifolia]|uniref:Uncharacterized protein n=1 Tax=Vanilla planifolia TaxID=51239 RepID=A0A835PHQ3_VANPL|nr:hypothetical protein HPP92_026156 [Vanilla planifolia]
MVSWRRQSRLESESERHRWSSFDMRLAISKARMDTFASWRPAMGKVKEPSGATIVGRLESTTLEMALFSLPSHESRDMTERLVKRIQGINCRNWKKKIVFLVDQPFELNSIFFCGFLGKSSWELSEIEHQRIIHGEDGSSAVE